jgi:hypothetical protein
MNFSGILGHEGPQDFRVFILQETLPATSEQLGRNLALLQCIDARNINT